MVVSASHDSALALAFLRQLYPDGPWLLTAIEVDKLGIETRSFRPGDEDDLATWLRRFDHRNVYYSVNRPARDQMIKTEKTDIAAAHYLHVDIDPRAIEDLSEERTRILKLLESPPPPIPRPTVVVFSGGGYNALWKLDTPFAIAGDIEKALTLERYNLKLEIALGGDHCHNVDRICRLPGTWNHPDAKKRKKGRETAQAQLVWWSADVYSIDRFAQAAPIQISGSGLGVVQTSKRRAAPGNLRRLTSVDELGDDVSSRTKMLIVQGGDPDDPTKNESRSETLFHVCCELIRAKVPDDVIYSVVTDPDFRISASVLDKGSSVERYALRQIERAHEWTKNPWLEYLNKRHAVIANYGGSCRVMELIEDPILHRTKITMQTFTDFRNRYMNERVRVGQNDDGSDKKAPLGKWWLENTDRRQHDSIVFAPGAPDTGHSYNLWQGFKYEPVPGDRHVPFLNMIREDISTNDQSVYNYIVGWLARCVQHPASPGEVAIAMRGRRGTGKSTFAKCFGELFGKHYMPISNAQHLVGNFNDHLRDTLVLFADEAFYAGDKKHESILKTLITEETFVVEKKGIDAEIAPNFTHILMATNENWVVPAGPDERRYLVIDVNDIHIQDDRYFGGVRDALRSDNGLGYSNLLHFLQSYDLRTFNVRRIPNTKALRDQKLLSMSSEVEWWHARLEDGVLAPGHIQWHEQILKRVIVDDYLTYAQRVGSRNRSTQSSLGRFLRKVCGAGLKTFTATHKYRDHFGTDTKEKAAFYRFPPLEECRRAFDQIYGGPFDWPEIVDERDRVPEREAF